MISWEARIRVPTLFWERSSSPDDFLGKEVRVLTLLGNDGSNAACRQELDQFTRMDQQVRRVVAWQD